jgi:hypothetical protein
MRDSHNSCNLHVPSLSEEAGTHLSESLSFRIPSTTIGYNPEMQSINFSKASNNSVFGYGNLDHCLDDLEDGRQLDHKKQIIANALAIF